MRLDMLQNDVPAVFKLKKMKNKELYQVKIGLTLLGEASGVKLGICRARLIRKVKELISDMEDYRNSLDWKESEKLLLDVNKEYANRDEKGNIITSNGRYVIGNTEGMRDAVVALENKHKKVFNERMRMIEEYNKLLEMDCEELPKIPVSLLPESTKTEVINLLFPIIDENN